MKKTLLYKNPDGSPHYLFEAEGDEIAVMTGPAVATVTLADGEELDITDTYIGVSPEKHDEVVLAIADHYTENGHELVDNFEHDRAATDAVLAEVNAASLTSGE